MGKSQKNKKRLKICRKDENMQVKWIRSDIVKRNNVIRKQQIGLEALYKWQTLMLKNIPGSIYEGNIPLRISRRSFNFINKDFWINEG